MTFLVDWIPLGNEKLSPDSLAGQPYRFTSDGGKYIWTL